MTFHGPEVKPYAVTTNVAVASGGDDALAATVTLNWRRGSKEQAALFHAVLLRDESAARLAEVKAARSE